MVFLYQQILGKRIMYCADQYFDGTPIIFVRWALNRFINSEEWGDQFDEMGEAMNSSVNPM